MAKLKLSSVANIAGKQKKDSAIPTKQTINFVHTQRNLDPKRIAVIAAVAVLLLSVVIKFGIIDQEHKRTLAKGELAAQQAQLAEINAKLADYDELAAKYARYSYGLMNERETGMVDRMEALELLENHVLKVATIEDFALNENVLTINMHGITLDRASQIVKELESSPLVKSAAVYSASAEDAKEASIFMSITLTKEVADQ